MLKYLTFVACNIIRYNYYKTVFNTITSKAIVLDREYLQDQYEEVLVEIKTIMERVLREDLKNGGLIITYYSWTKINYKKDFTAVFIISSCSEVWEVFEEAKAERLVSYFLQTSLSTIEDCS